MIGDSVYTYMCVCIYVYVFLSLRLERRFAYNRHPFKLYSLTEHAADCLNCFRPGQTHRTAVIKPFNHNRIRIEPTFRDRGR